MPDLKYPYSERVVVAAPTGRDEEVTLRLFASEGIECIAHKDAGELVTAIGDGVGALMLTDISLADGRSASLLRAVEQQPEWSSIPVLLLCRDGRPSASMLPSIRGLRNVTILDRPSSIRALVSAVRAALLGRRWQYKIRDQMLELQSADAALRLADRRKDEFLATLAHELRNPLAPIRTGVQLLEAIRTDKEQFARVQGMMERQLGQLVKLIDELLDVSRIATGKIVLHREQLDLRDVIRTAIESCQPAIDAAGHRVTLELPVALVRVSGDRTRLSQAVSNILNNAIKYTPAGGSIQIQLTTASGQAVLTVQDSGVGIPHPMLTRVFDLFAQVNRTLDRSQGGLGIGLSLVRSLVTLHDGTVEAASEGEGRGSLFTVRLPLETSAPVVAAVTQGEPYEERRRRLRVLVIDDNQDAADSLGLLIRTQGHDVRIAYSGDTALETANDFRPDAVFCDIGMPKMSGIEFASRIRSETSVRQPVLVAVTGWGGTEDRRRTKQAGYSAHLTKPVSSQIVREVLAHV